MYLTKRLMQLMMLLWTVCCIAKITGKLERERHVDKKHESISRATNVDFIMMAPPLTNKNTNMLGNNGISTKKHEGNVLYHKNYTHPGIILQFKTFWNSNDRTNRSRRLLEITLKPMFFICCLCVLVLIYFLYRAVRIRRNLKKDKNIIQTDSNKIYQNEA